MEFGERSKTIQANWQSRFARTWDAFSIICVMGAGLATGLISLFTNVEDTLPLPSITLVLLGLVGTHFAVERFSTIRRLEEKLDSINEVAELADLPTRQRDIHRRASSAFIQLQKDIGNLRPDEKYFKGLSNELLVPLDKMLQQLAKARIMAPPYQIVAIQEKLGKVFTRRFDAVTERDLDFWDQSPEPDVYSVAEGYFNQHVHAIKRGTVLTRIFIVTLRDITERHDRLCRVLRRHQLAGIGWGLAVFEELEEPLRATEGRLDFGLFDRGRALSYFQREYPWRLEVVFRMDAHAANEAEIKLQIAIHQQLIAECWCVSGEFARCYVDIHGEPATRRIHKALARHNRHLREKVTTVQFDHDHFVYVAHAQDEVASKIEALSSTISQYRSNRGGDTRGRE